MKRQRRIHPLTTLALTLLFAAPVVAQDGADIVLVGFQVGVGGDGLHVGAVQSQDESEIRPACPQHPGDFTFLISNKNY